MTFLGQTTIKFILFDSHMPIDTICSLNQAQIGYTKIDFRLQEKLYYYSFIWYFSYNPAFLAYLGLKSLKGLKGLKFEEFEKFRVPCSVLWWRSILLQE